MAKKLKGWQKAHHAQQYAKDDGKLTYWVEYSPVRQSWAAWISTGAYTVLLPVEAGFQNKFAAAAYCELNAEEARRKLQSPFAVYDDFSAAGKTLGKSASHTLDALRYMVLKP